MAWPQNISRRRPPGLQAATGVDTPRARPAALYSSMTLLLPLVMRARSAGGVRCCLPNMAVAARRTTMPLGPLPSKMPSVAPVGDSSVTVSAPALVTHMFVPSNAMPPTSTMLLVGRGRSPASAPSARAR